ncbi:MAG: hypothetical protein QOE14_2985 [Humisphaera sp.]|nr:hypothetical protein [Humisphaera sp.]
MMKLPKHVLIGICVAAVVAIVVGVLLTLTLSAPRKRTVVVEPRRPTVDEAIARKEIDRRIADYRAKGERILVADFKPKPIDPKDNAAEPLMASAAWLDKPEFDKDPAWQIDIIPEKLTDAQWQQIDAAVARFAPALALIDQADGRDAVDWKIEFKSPAMQILLRSLNGARQSANLLRMAALSSHRAGRDDETVHRLTQMTVLARHVDIGHPALVGHLVGSGIVRLTTETLADVAPTLKIAPIGGSGAGGGSSASTLPASNGAASREKIAALIAALLDPRTLDHGWAQAAQAERMFMHDNYQCLIDGRMSMNEFVRTSTGKQSTAAKIAAPSTAEMLTELAPMLDYMDGLVAASKAARLPEYRKQQRTPPTALTEVGRNLLPSYDRAATVHYTAVTYLRLGAAALAVRAWSADHNGALPASLNDLVPEYLPGVPDDAMSVVPAPLLYATGPTPIVYSAGVNEIRRPAAAATRGAAPRFVKPDFSIPLSR